MEVWRKCKGETEMGRMLICHDKKAENPLYMKEFELHIYAIEELCFCLNKNLHMLDNHIMKEQLCSFLEQELELPQLAAHLRVSKVCSFHYEVHRLFK